MKVAEASQAYEKITDLLAEIESVYNRAESEELDEAFDATFKALTKLRITCNSVQIPEVKQRGRPPKKKVEAVVEKDEEDTHEDMPNE